MSNITMKNLLEAGVHFGHQKKKWNPKMAKYIFGERNNIHIIDLQKTVRALKKAYFYVRDGVASGKNVLFVGTKRQAQEVIKEEAKRASMFYINHRWLGGTLTNFMTIRKSIERLKFLDGLKHSPTWAKLSKKEVARLDKELQKLDKALSGIKDMEELPGMVIIIDPLQELTAIREARKLGIPVISVVDTDSDPDLIDIPIPGNDDAIRAIKLFVSVLADAALEGKQVSQKQVAEEAQEDIKDKEERRKKKEENKDEGEKEEIKKKKVENGSPEPAALRMTEKEEKKMDPQKSEISEDDRVKRKDETEKKEIEKKEENKEMKEEKKEMKEEKKEMKEEKKEMKEEKKETEPRVVEEIKEEPKKEEAKEEIKEKKVEKKDESKKEAGQAVVKKSETKKKAAKKAIPKKTTSKKPVKKVTAKKSTTKKASGKKEDKK